MIYFFKKKFSSMYAWRIECLSSLFAFGFATLQVAFPPPYFRPFEQYSFWSVHNIGPCSDRFISQFYQLIFFFLIGKLSLLITFLPIRHFFLFHTVFSTDIFKWLGKIELSEAEFKEFEPRLNSNMVGST